MLALHKNGGGGKHQEIILKVEPTIDCNGICQSVPWDTSQISAVVWRSDSSICCAVNVTVRSRQCLDNGMTTNFNEVEILRIEPQANDTCNCSVQEIMNSAIKYVLNDIRGILNDTSHIYFDVYVRTSKCWKVDSSDNFALKSCDTTKCYQTKYGLFYNLDSSIYIVDHETEGNDEQNPCGSNLLCQDVISSHDIPDGFLFPRWYSYDSSYSPNTLTIWFKKESINQQLICDYWNYYHNPPIIKEQLPKTLTSLPNGTGCFPVDSNIILNNELLQFLLDSGAVTMCQYTTFSPCVDTLSFTRNGDTIKTPPFWNSFVIQFDRDTVIGILYTLLQRYSGNSIIFAELNYHFIIDGEPPNDPYFLLLGQQKNLEAEFGCNMPVAWDKERGSRDIKVGIIDNGFKYTLPEFGGGIGPDKRFVAGKFFNYNPVLPVQPEPFNMTNESDDGDLVNPGVKGGEHGTPVSSFIGAITNNSEGIASIAGGWYDGTSVVGGVSLYGLKCAQNNESTIWQKNLVDAWCYAAASTSGHQGYGVHIITASASEAEYCEECRQALDYAYSLGVVCFAAKGNFGQNLTCYPADYEYNKICAVGAYTLEYGVNKQLVPTRFDGESNFGYGLDIMASGIDEGTIPEFDGFNEVILNNGDYSGPWGHTSGATPQVAAVGSLILSKYLRNGNQNIEKLYPEDVHGLLCISTLDLNFEYYDNGSFKDTNGYDAETGYGMLKADKALENMENPYELRHFTETGGEVVEVTDINDFLVMGFIKESDEVPLLPPTEIGVYDYRAKRYKIHKEITLTDWEEARSWGLGGKGTVGWSRVQPIEIDPDNHLPKPNQFIAERGFCRVVGDGMPGDNNFNFNNLRDISYRNDVITLETYCYEVWNKDEAQNPDQGYKGWFPCETTDVVYRYTIWGKKKPVSVSEEQLIKTNKIKLWCEENKLFGNKYLVVHYKMEEPGPVELSVYDILGNKVSETKRDTWDNSNEQRISIKADNLINGIYLLVMKSNNSVGICKYIQAN